MSDLWVEMQVSSWEVVNHLDDMESPPGDEQENLHDDGEENLALV